MEQDRKSHRGRGVRPTAAAAAGLLAFVLGGFSVSEGAEKFPAGPVKIMVPAGSGGSLGREVRAIAPFLEKKLGVATPVEYVTGADGMIAYNKFAQEKPDGYTVLCFNLASAVSIEVTRDTAKYKVEEYTPVAVWNGKTHAIVTSTEKWKSFSEFLDDAKKGTVSVAVVGGSSTLQGRLMESSLGLKINWVPYKDSGEALAAVAGNHVDSLLTFSSSPIPLVRAGKIRPLAVFAPKPDPILPGVPCLPELGHPEVPLVVVYGVIMAPPNTPKELAAVLEKAVAEATADPAFVKSAENASVTVDFQPASELQKRVQADFDIITKYKQFLK